MQIIQGIREKGAAIVVGVIALCLIGFILMDANKGANQSSMGGPESIGSINGTSVGSKDFENKVKMQEEAYEQQSQRAIQSSEKPGIRQQIWDKTVQEAILYKEANKLGMDFSLNNMSVVFSSNDPSDNPLMQDKSILDSTGKYIDRNQLQQRFAYWKKLTGEAREKFDFQVTDQQRLYSIYNRYMGYLNAASYYPTWMQEYDNKAEKEFAQVSYVNIPYSVISDSTIKITDEDVNNYVKRHKALFKQEAGRAISFVAFSKKPSADDSLNTMKQVAAMKESFAADNNPRNFITANGSTIEYDSSFVMKGFSGGQFGQPMPRIHGPEDSILSQPTGTVYGPYQYQNSYVLAKVLGVKMAPDSAKIRHILIGTSDPQTGQPTMSDSAAKVLADSIYAAVQGGADFGMLAFKYSTDIQSKLKMGDLGWASYGSYVPEFNEASFNKPVGTRSLVHTRFGYHVLEVMAQKMVAPKYRIGYMAKDILASDLTVDNANNTAARFANDKSANKFDSAYLKKAGLELTKVDQMLKENDNTVGRFSEARSLVKWAFSAKPGDVSEAFNMGSDYVVARLDKIYKEGIQDAETARPRATPFIINEKKGEMILQKIGTNATIEGAAASYSVKDTTAGMDSSLTFASRAINGMEEPKVIGSLFNKGNANKIMTLAGKYGVYVYKVINIGMKAPDTPDQVIAKKKDAETQLRAKASYNWMEGLKSQATIKDKRSDIY